MLPNETRQRVLNLPQNILPSGHALKHIALDETPQLTPFHFGEVLALPTDQAPHLISKPKPSHFEAHLILWVSGHSLWP